MRRSSSKLFVLLLLASPLQAQRVLHWQDVRIDATLAQDGSLRVVETQTMVFSGDWNGGERTFNLRPRQGFRFEGMRRIDSTGQARVMTEGPLDEVDNYAFTNRRTLRWRSRVSSEVLAPPQHGSGTVIAYAVDGKVFALDAQTGKIRWQFDTQVPLLTLRGLATPRIVDDRVLVGLANGRVLALQLSDGKNLWSTEVAPARGRSEIERLVDVDATPLVLGDVAYCVAFQGQVTAISIATGRVLWARELSSTADMAYDDEALYVTSPDGSLTALTRSAGEILWRQDALQYRYVTGPARLGEYLIVGDIEGYMHWLDRHTGNIVHRKRLDDAPIGSEPIVAGSQVFFLSRGGILDAWTLPNSPVTPSAAPGAAS